MPPGPSLEATGSMIQYNSVESASPTLVIGRGAGEPEDGPERKTHLASLPTKTCSSEQCTGARSSS